MLISEVLDLVKEKPLAQVAKEHLSIGEKPARLAMVRAGCYSITGQAGWFLDEEKDPENLNKSIYYFAEQVKRENEAMFKAAANLETFEETIFVPRKRHSFDLDVRIVKELKLHCVKEDKTLYEVVESALKAYLDAQTGEE